MYRSHVLVCGGTGCSSSTASRSSTRWKRRSRRRVCTEEVKVVKTGCFGLCALGPIMIVYPEGSFYSEVKPSTPRNRPGASAQRPYRQTAALPGDRPGGQQRQVLNETNFYAKQHRVALRNCGVINPENIDEYIAVDGYRGAGQGSDRNDPAAGHRRDPRIRLTRPRRRRLPHRQKVELRGSRIRPTRSMSAATPTKATPARSWIVRFSRATPTSCWRL